MLLNLSNKFHRWAKGWLIFVLLALYGFFAGFLMPLVGGLTQGGRGGIQPLDTMLFSTPERTFEMIERYGEYGRPFYRAAALTIDIAYPIVYLFALGLLLSWLLQRGVSPGSRMKRLNVLPLGIFAFDLLENLTIAALLTIYPAQPAALAWVLMFLTTVKWAFAAASVGLVLVGLAMAAKNGFKKQG